MPKSAVTAKARDYILDATESFQHVLVVIDGKLGACFTKENDSRSRASDARRSKECSSCYEHSKLTIDQSSSGLRRCVAVYLPTRLPTAVPTSVLLRQCIPPHTRAFPSSAWISL